MKYKNPIIPGFYPDPSICRVGEDFYLVTSSFEYFPGVPIFHSRNLVNWRQIGHCLTRKSQLSLTNADISGGIYAPTIRHYGDRFYMITTNVTNGGHFYVWTHDPAGEWSEPVWVNQAGIDPDLFWDEDDSVYFSCSGGPKGIVQRKIDIVTGECLTKPVHTWPGCGGKYPEAPHLYKIDGHYYLLIAEGGTEYGHCVTIARSLNPMGPWVSCPDNPILTHRSSDLPIQATGHADLVQDQNGNWWLVCLGIRPKGYHPYHVLGRETFLAPMKWKDGWPIIGNNGQIALEMNGHEGLPQVSEEFYSTHDDFDGDLLPYYWNFLGNPVPNSYLLKSDQSRLALKCRTSGLNVMEGLSWLGRRQQHIKFRCSAQIEFDPQGESEEAGITIFQNVNHHYEIALVNRDNIRSLIVRRTIGSLSNEVATVTITAGPIILVIEGNEAEYRLGYALGDSKRVFLAKGEARYLSTEVGGRFTGVYLAMYATANGELSENLALFDWFAYEVLDQE